MPNKLDTRFLDTLRGFSALMVFVGHSRWLLWEGYAEGYVKHPELYNGIEKGVVYFLSLFRFGHESVIFFFVLSGFVIHLRYSKKLSFTKQPVSFDYKDYFYRRFHRIYPPFIFALVLTYGIDKLGIYNEFSIYSNRTNNISINTNIHSNHGFLNLMGNLFFIETEYIRDWGTNSPLWSLKFEWWFYVIYPFIFFLSRKNVWYPLVLILSLIGVLSLFSNIQIYFFIRLFEYLAIWWFGAIIADVYTKRFQLDFFYLSFLSLFIFIAIFCESYIPTILLKDLLWGLGFSGIVSFLFFLQEKKISLTVLNKFKILGDFSYTLYICHFPILVFLSGFLMFQNNNYLPKTPFYALLIIPFVLAISYLLYQYIEKPYVSKK